MTVNDGKGLYDSDGLLDSLIVDCNNVVKELCSGQYIEFCRIILEMAQKLVELKKGIKADLESKDKTIDELTGLCNELSKEKGGDNDGVGS